MTKSIVLVLTVVAGVIAWNVFGGENQDNSSGKPVPGEDIPVPGNPVIEIGRTVLNPWESQRDTSESLQERIHRKLIEEGGIERSDQYLAEKRQALIESGGKPPFEIGYLSLKVESKVSLPTTDSLWELTTVGMQEVGDILVNQAQWLRNNELSVDSTSLLDVREDLHRRSVYLPPEAIAIGLTGSSWDSIIEDTPALVVSLGRIRERNLLEYARLQTEVWKMQTGVYQAALESGVDLGNPATTIQEILAQNYPPLNQALLEIELVKESYLSQISQELIAAGYSVYESKE